MQLFAVALFRPLRLGSGRSVGTVTVSKAAFVKRKESVLGAAAAKAMLPCTHTALSPNCSDFLFFFPLLVTLI